MAARRMYVAVAVPAATNYDMVNGELVPVPAVPQVMGPFSTPNRARKAAEEDWTGLPVHWIVLPLWGHRNTRDEQVSLVYDRLLDPALRSRCPACKQTIKRKGDEEDDEAAA